MAVSYGAFEVGSSSLSTSVTANKPASTATGSFLIAECGATGSTTYTAPSNTISWVQVYNSGGLAVFVKYVTNGADEPASYTFTQSNGLLNNRLAISRWEGVDSTTQVIDSAASLGSGAPSSPSVTATAADQMLLSLVMYAASTSATTKPASMTQAYQSNASATRAGAYEQLSSSGATGTRSWSLSNSHGVFSLILNPAATDQTVSPNGLGASVGMGSPTVTASKTVTVNGLAVATSFGSPTVSPQSVTIGPDGLASVTAFGSPTIAPQPVTASPSGIAVSASLGSPGVTVGSVTVSPAGLAVSTALGSPAVSSTYSVSPSGIGVSVGIGSPTVSPQAVTVAPSGLAAGAALGSPTVSRGAVTVAPSGIAVSVGMGTPSVDVGIVIVYPSGLEIEAAFGTPVVNLENADQVLSMTGLVVPVAFGDAEVVLTSQAIYPSGLAVGVGLGTPTVTRIGGFVPIAGETLQHAMNRLAGTLNVDSPTLDATAAANVWAETEGLDLVGALNVKAGNTLAEYRELQGVLNQLAGTSGLGVAAAAAAIEA